MSGTNVSTSRVWAHLIIARIPWGGYLLWLSPRNRIRKLGSRIWFRTTDPGFTPQLEFLLLNTTVYSLSSKMGHSLKHIFQYLPFVVESVLNVNAREIWIKFSDLNVNMYFNISSGRWFRSGDRLFILSVWLQMNYFTFFALDLLWSVEV